MHFLYLLQYCTLYLGRRNVLIYESMFVCFPLCGNHIHMRIDTLSSRRNIFLTPRVRDVLSHNTMIVIALRLRLYIYEVLPLWHINKHLKLNFLWSAGIRVRMLRLRIHRC